MENTDSCGMKVVDHKTKYIAIRAYNDNDNEDEDRESIEPKCEYSILRADDNLIEALNDIKRFDLRLIEGNLYDTGLIKLFYTEFSVFDCYISFFGDNPNLKDRTELYKSTISPKNSGKIFNLENVEGNFDYELYPNNDGTPNKYEKSHIRLGIGYPIRALYCPMYSQIVFRCFKDNKYDDYKTFPVNIDHLIDFIAKDR
jgi:hypothetical protein